MIKRSLVIFLLLCCFVANGHGAPTLATSAFSRSITEIAKEALKSVGSEAVKTAVDNFKNFFNRNKKIAKNNKNPQLRGGEVVGEKRAWSMAGGNLTKPELQVIAETLKSLDQNREQEIKSKNGTINTVNITTGDNSPVTQQTGPGLFVSGNNNKVILTNPYPAGKDARANSANTFGAPAPKDKCPTPYEYITKVYSAGGKAIEYELSPNFDYEKMHVVFFGEWDVVQRFDTMIPLKTTKGIFEIPKRALLTPVQRGFNFIITDTNNCERWGVVEETTLKAEGKEENKIRIDHINQNDKSVAFVIDGLIN